MYKVTEAENNRKQNITRFFCEMRASKRWFGKMQRAQSWKKRYFILEYKLKLESDSEY